LLRFLKGLLSREADFDRASGDREGGDTESRAKGEVHAAPSLPPLSEAEIEAIRKGARRGFRRSFYASFYTRV
jgi:hypothetical protein